MDKMIAPSTYQSSATHSIGLTGAAQPGKRALQPMTDRNINTAFDKLLHLHSAAGEAVAQFAAIGAIREVIFRPGSVIFDAYERDAKEAQLAIQSLGDPKADALMAEIMNLAHRMVQLESKLPPAQPLTKDLKTWPAHNGGTASLAAASPSGELNLAGIALYLATGTLWNYLSTIMSRPELHLQTRYILCQSELEKWCNWNETSRGGNIELSIEDVTRHLSGLCM
jgi:hypothetical protein